MKYKCYLAGAITGLSYDDSEDWRVAAKTMLSHCDIQGISPLRGKEHLKKLEVIPALPNVVNKPMSTVKGIFARDTHDIRRCDAVLANLLGAKSVSIGTVMEIALAFELRKPVVLVMEHGNIHEHPFLFETCPFIVNTLQDGVDLMAEILL